MTIAIVDERPATGVEWDRLWRASPCATYFHSREWAEVWSEYSAGKLLPDARMVVFADGTEALLPVSRQQLAKGLGARIFSSYGGTYGGWLSASELTAAHARLLAAHLHGLSSNLYWRLNPYDALALGLATRGAQPEHTQAIDLRDGFEAVVRRWSRGHRSSAHKGQRAGVVVRRATSEADWRAYVTIYEASRDRWGSALRVDYRSELFDVLRRRASEHVELWLAVVDEVIVAGALCFTTPWHTVYWHGSALEAYFPLRPVNWLMHEVIRDACERGGTWFDFNPSAGLEGVHEFKQRFGAQELSCPVVSRETARVKLVRRIRLRARLRRRA
jgi:CelD/BcsL family acetyltransferase involved in cellulose biosynthesis